MHNPLAVLILAAVFVPLEKLFGRRAARVFRPGWRVDAAHGVLSPWLQDLATVLLVGTAIWLLEPLVHQPLQDAVAAQPKALQVAELVLLAELVGYFAHRAFHRVPWLWRIHAVHHSSEQLDWLAALRAHPFNEAITRCLQFIPLYLLGFSPGVLGGAVLLLGLWAICLHANVRWRFGWLEHVLATPHFHHWHHARGADANFAGLFPWIDALFGTRARPPGWPERFGCDAPVPETFRGQLAFPLTRPPR